MTIKNLISGIVILLGLIGVYFGIVGLFNFDAERLLFILVILISILGIVSSLITMISHSKIFDSKNFGSFFVICGGLVFIIAGIYMIFSQQFSLGSNFMFLCMIIFFSFGVVKEIIKLIRR